MAHFRLRLLCLSLLSLFFVAIPRARAADFPPISDEDLRFKEVPGHPGAPAAILFREEIDDDRDNHDHMTYMRMKVLTEAGRKYADVTLHFEKTWSDISDVRGRTVHVDGTVVPFDGKVLDKEVVKGFGLREHVKSFSLPDVQVGSIIEYRYHFRYRDNTVAAPLWVIQNELWQKKVHFKFIPSPRDIVLDHGQIGHGVAWSTFGPKDLQPKDVEMPNNLGYIELSASDIPPYVKEPHMLDTLKFKYYARFFYRTASKPEQYWKQQGGFWSHDAEKFMGKKDGIADRVNEIVAATDTPEQKVKKIYAFIAGLENQTYLPSRTSQEIKTLGLKDRGASDILTQKSGDRDDLTLLFIAMVRAAGIQAYPMIITSRDDNFFEPYYMSMDQLDTQIAIVTLDGKGVFLDPGTKFCPYGMLPWQYTATQGIRETDHGTEIAQTPEPNYKNAITERIAKLSLDDNGAISGPLKVEYLGEDAMLHRQNALLTDAEGRKKNLEEEVKTWLPAGAEVKLLQEPDWNATSNEFMAVFHISTPVAASAGKRVLLPAHVFQSNEKPMFTAATRVNGIYLYYPSREVDQVSITLPSDLEVDTLPQPDTERLQRYALYKSEWIQDPKQPKTITVVRDLANADYAFPVTDYPTLKDFYDKVKSGDEQQAILKVNANAAGN